MGDEKRKFTRVPFRVQAEMTFNKVLYAAEELSNLSIGGCLLKINEDLEPEGDCRIRIFLTGVSPEQSVEVNGKIVRYKNGYVAVKFTNIDPDSLFHLQNIILYNSADPDEVEQEILDHPGIL